MKRIILLSFFCFSTFLAYGQEPIRTFSGHTKDVNSVCFSPDGKTALSGSADKTLKLWDLNPEKIEQDKQEILRKTEQIFILEAERQEEKPENIDNNTKKFDMPNGMKLALFSRKSIDEAVFARLTLRFGDLNSLTNKGSVASYVARLLDKGTKTKNRQQINDGFDKLKARVNFLGGAANVVVMVQTTRANLSATLRLVAEVIKEANFPSEELENMVLEDITLTEQHRSEAQTMGIMRINKHTSAYPKGDPRYTEDKDEELASIKAVKIDDVRRFYTEFYGASNATMAVVGDFDEKEIETLISELFGNWKSPKKFERLVSIYKEVPVLNEKMEFPDKTNAFFFARLPLQIDDSDPDYAALTLGNFMLGGGFLNSRLKILRWLSYSVRSQFSANSQDKVGVFAGYAIYSPENVEKLEKGYREEIQKVLTEGFTAEEIAAAKSGWLQDRNVKRSQNIDLAGIIENNLYLNRTLAWSAELEKKVSELTPEQIKAAMNKHIKVDKISIVKAGNFKKTEEVKKVEEVSTGEQKRQEEQRLTRFAEFTDGVYEGDFIIQNNKKTPNGQGKITYNGEVSDPTKFYKTISYEGGWLNGLAHGQGTLIYADGIKFVGNFVNGELGYGTMYLKDGVKLEGEWTHNRSKCHYFPSLFNPQSFAITGFSGNYCPVRSLKQANAKMTYSNGSVKEGYWQPPSGDITSGTQVSFIAYDLDKYTEIMDGRASERETMKYNESQKRQEELELYETMTIPSVRSQNCFENSSSLDGAYQECKIIYSDDVQGRYFISRSSGKFFLEKADGSNYYYKDYSATIRALYIYKKYGEMITKGRN